MSTKSRTQAWCIPSERMTNTVWVASISPKPVADGRNPYPAGGRRTGREPVSIARWYSTATKKKQPCSQSPERCSRRSGVLEGPGRILLTCLPQPRIRTVACNPFASLTAPLTGRGGTHPGSAVYQRRPAPVAGALSGSGLPHHRLRYELRPAHANGRPPHIRQCVCQS